MNYHLKKYTILTMGLILFAFGVVLMVKTDLGLSPWDSFNQGFSRLTGVTLGQASMIVGVTVFLIDIYALNQPIGTGSIIDLIIVGLFIDIFSLILPNFSGYYLLVKIFIFILGLIVCGYGCLIYIPQGLGCGPIDSLLIGLTRKINKPFGKITIAVEAFALVSGFFMGGTIGIGTVISVLLKGPILQFIFSFHKVDIKSIKHKNLKEELIILKDAFK